jgi:hypothetical protein
MLDVFVRWNRVRPLIMRGAGPLIGIAILICIVLREGIGRT